MSEVVELHLSFKEDNDFHTKALNFITKWWALAGLAHIKGMATYSEVVYIYSCLKPNFYNSSENKLLTFKLRQNSAIEIKYRIWLHCLLVPTLMYSAVILCTLPEQLHQNYYYLLHGLESIFMALWGKFISFCTSKANKNAKQFLPKVPSHWGSALAALNRNKELNLPKMNFLLLPWWNVFCI